MIASRLAVAAALSLVFSAPTAAQAPAQTIMMWSYGFAPNPIRLAAGQPVTLIFQNRSRGSHDFTAKAFFASSRILSGDLMNGMVDLRGGEVKRITLIPRAGIYKAHCTHLFHEPLGMSDTIYVN